MDKGPGGIEAELNELDFAKDVLCGVSNIAGRLAASEKLCDAGCLAASLWMAMKALDTADASQLPRLQKRLPKLLDDLERVCAWPSPSDPRRPILRSILGKSTYRSLDEAEAKVQKGVYSFLVGPAFVKEQYFKNLDQFYKRAMTVKEAEHKVSKAKAADTEEYPSHVNSVLYSVLRDHSRCTCMGGYNPEVTKSHHARLRLRADIVKVDECIAFEMLMSASPNDWDYWQDLQLTVSMRKAGKRRVKYTDEGTNPCSQKSRRFRVISPGSLCELLRAKPGCRICCRVHDSALQQLYDSSPITQHTDPGPSISLREILQTHRLSNRMKLVLAYITARSFWQYYDSPWMKAKWTSDSMHFLPEPPPEEGPLGEKDAAFYASRPYYVVQFVEEDDPFSEYCDSYSVIYRYPRLLALCIMLLEIGRGESLPILDRGSMEATLNANWSLAKRLVDNPRSWGDFDYPDYRKVVLNCLNRKLFDEASAAEDRGAEMDIISRKAILHEVVVAPLERLLKLLGFWEDLYNIDPIDSRGPNPIIGIPPPAPLPSTSKDHEAIRSARWLDKLHEINTYIYNTSRKSPQGQTDRAVTIAILDTGYDHEATFFRLPDRRRHMKGWRDWAGDSQLPIDENGHGTHTVALVMKVAPFADIYVARVARDRSSLKNCTRNISEAIRWAVNDCGVDMISMSFGFQGEIPDISQTIREAELLRQNRILFFAAASNSGGNHKEMFPANHDSVISIRSTNSNGAFLDANPPVDPNGPVVYGTLGKDVPSAWLCNVDGELPMSGSSVATAVAVGIAAMMLAFADAGFSNSEFPLPPEVRRLWTRRGMISMFAKMSEDMGNRCFFVSPVKFFSERNAIRGWAAMIDACV